MQNCELLPSHFDEFASEGRGGASCKWNWAHLGQSSERIFNAQTCIPHYLAPKSAKLIHLISQLSHSHPIIFYWETMRKNHLPALTFPSHHLICQPLWSGLVAGAWSRKNRVTLRPSPTPNPNKHQFSRFSLHLWSFSLSFFCWLNRHIASTWNWRLHFSFTYGCSLALKDDLSVQHPQKSNDA